MKLLIMLLSVAILTGIVAVLDYKNVPDMSCVETTWHRVMICEYPIGKFTHYTTGDVVLAGNVPADNRWNGRSFHLSGYLVHNGSCTMLVVERATPCAVLTSSK